MSWDILIETLSPSSLRGRADDLQCGRADDRAKQTRGQADDSRGQLGSSNSYTSSLPSTSIVFYIHECVTFKIGQLSGWREAENSTDQVASARASAAPVLQYHGHSTAPTW